MTHCCHFRFHHHRLHPRLVAGFPYRNRTPATRTTSSAQRQWPHPRSSRALHDAGPLDRPTRRTSHHRPLPYIIASDSDRCPLATASRLGSCRGTVSELTIQRFTGIRLHVESLLNSKVPTHRN